jgi:hypothetical protein
MADMDDIYAAFVRDWQAGLAPDLDAFLSRADPADREALAERIETFVMVAPAVELQPDRAAEIQASPAFLRALAIADDPAPSTWGARLRAGRERAGLGLPDLGERFAAAFGLAGRGEKAATLLGRLESDDLAPVGVSERAARRLEELLGLAADALRPPQLQFRADDAPAGPAASAPAPAPAARADAAVGLDLLIGGDLADWDELDDLLRGGG